jgi:GGDEF domain-containing protein
MNPRTAERLLRATRAAQALSETLWEELHEELTDPRQQRVAELSLRLADISATVALLARSDPGSLAVLEPASPVGPKQPLARATPAQTPPPQQSPPGREPPMPEPSSMAVLVDEMAPATQVQEPPSAPPEPGAQAPQEIAIRDERHEHAHLAQAQDGQQQSAWIGAIERRLERYQRDRAPFAVLLVELADVERLRHAELPGEMSRLTGTVEAALSGELGPADSLTRESPGRYWLLAAETDARGSRELVERLASAVRSAVDHRRVPLEVAVGIALCPGHGDRAPELAAHAEIALYAARASGKPVT